MLELCRAVQHPDVAASTPRTRLSVEMEPPISRSRCNDGFKASSVPHGCMMPVFGQKRQRLVRAGRVRRLSERVLFVLHAPKPTPQLL